MRSSVLVRTQVPQQLSAKNVPLQMMSLAPESGLIPGLQRIFAAASFPAEVSDNWVLAFSKEKQPHLEQHYENRQTRHRCRRRRHSCRFLLPKQRTGSCAVHHEVLQVINNLEKARSSQGAGLFSARMPRYPKKEIWN